MFLRIFTQELLFWIKKPITSFFYFIFFSLSFVAYAGAAGLFDPHYDGSAMQAHLNSWAGINPLLQQFGKLLIIVPTVMMGTSVYKDFQYKFHSILYSYPINKADYLLGRFSASFLLVTILSSSVPLAMIIVEFLPGLDSAFMGVFKPQAYLHGFLLYILPNQFFFGALVFACTLTFRNMYAGFGVALLPFLLQIIFENAFIGNDSMIALLDPFGQNTISYYIRDWSIVERNQLPLPWNGLIIYNRLLWSGCGSIILIIAVYKYRLHEHSNYRLSWSKRSSYQPHPVSSTTQSPLNLSEIRQTSSVIHHLRLMWTLSHQAFVYVIRGNAFLAISLLAIMAVWFTMNRVSHSDDMVLMPLTKVIVIVPAIFYSIICTMLVFIYSGLLIHRERSIGYHQLIDSSPAPIWVFWVSKFMALVKVQVLLALIFILTGLSIQVYFHHYDFEIGLYIYHLSLVFVLSQLIWISAAFFVHVVVDNFYLGVFLLLMGWVGIQGLPQLGLNSHLLRFNTPPQLYYSDMNGYGHSLDGYLTVQGYWIGLGILLLLIVHLLWQHGAPLSFVSRCRRSLSRLSSSTYPYGVIAIAIMISCGSLIYEGESDQFNLSSEKLKKQLAHFEKGFQQYEGRLSPKIKSIKANIEIYPEEGRFKASGNYIIENPWSVTIDTLLIRTGFDENSLFWMNVPTKEVQTDSFMKFHVVQLLEPIASGGKMTLFFEVESQPNSLFDKNSSILQNGTFLKHDFLPSLGYSFSDSLLHPTDSLAQYYNYQSLDADLVHLSINVGTSKDQMAIAPGVLMEQWKENNRSYYKYETKHPVKFSFGINSGKYDHQKTEVANTILDIYSHHSFNIEKMKEGIEQTLTYCQTHFGKFAYPDLRVIEFPESEGTYATAFANNIPMSEIRFISNADQANKKPDLSFYVPAHELIHHWWGAKVIPARAQGATMLSESITEYLTLRVYESNFGEEMADEFLSLQHHRYWSGHNKENHREPPLYLVQPEQQYISYGKGTVVFNALAQYVGLDHFSKILSQFLNNHGTAHPPYPTSIDFINHLKESLPDSLDKFISQNFLNVSYYENSLKSAEVTSIENEKYLLDINMSFSKWSIDTKDVLKTPSPSKLNDWVQLGIYDQEGALMMIKWLNVEAEEVNHRLLLDHAPGEVRIDPKRLLLEKKVKDNRLRLN